MPTPILALKQSLRWHHYIMQHHDAPVPPTMPVRVASAPAPNRLLTHEEVNALFRDVGLEPPKPAVPEHVRAACDHCWHRLVQTQMCCWCGQPRAIQHGPYLPEGDR